MVAFECGLKPIHEISGFAATYNTSGAPNAGLGFASIPKEGLGFQVGAVYDFNRVITGFTLAGVSASSTGSPGMTIILPEANIAFGLQMLYLFAGANYSIPSSTGTWGTGVSLSGTVGYQGGIGIWLGQHFDLELMYRSLAINIVANSSTTYNSTLAGFGANLAFTF